MGTCQSRNRVEDGSLLKSIEQRQLIFNTALRSSEQAPGLPLLLVLFITVIILLCGILFWIFLIQGQMTELHYISIISTESNMHNYLWVKPLYVTHSFWRLKWSFTARYPSSSVRHCMDTQLVIIFYIAGKIWLSRATWMLKLTLGGQRKK